MSRCHIFCKHRVRGCNGEVSFILFAVLVIALFPFVAFSEPSKKHPSPSQIAYPSDTTIEWHCWTMRPGESLEKLFGERWVEVAGFNRIDRRRTAVSGSMMNRFRKSSTGFRKTRR
jgi:hypothetical protein